MKILISWIALTNDFADSGVNTSGPNYFFHKYHFKHDLHVLLYTSDTETKAKTLENKLASDFPQHKIKTREVKIQDISNLTLVKTKSESILLELSDDEIDIFFSPGASIMQLSWYICHTTLGLKTRLIQLLRSKHSKSKDKPDLVYIESSFSEIPRSAVLKQNLIEKGKKKPQEFLMIKGIEPIYQRAGKIAQTDSVTVLITGETGTGKEHLAKFIHENSSRKNSAFEALNCSGFTDELLESRLFGHKKGSFTGAFSTENGIFKKADGGTVFLDEIGDITPYMQQVLLRVLQEKEIRPIGGNIEKIDVRIISATNKNLLKLVADGKFRSDLYYRLSVTDLHLPALRELSTTDKKQILEFFVSEKMKSLKKNKKLELSADLYKFILKYNFPGNIRELENLIERFYVFCPDKADMQDLPKELTAIGLNDNMSLAAVEKLHIQNVLKNCNYKKLQAATILGIALNTLKSKIKMYNINQ